MWLKTYPEALVGKLTKKALPILDMKDSEFFEGVGYYFVEFVCEFGYGDVLALLGRQLRDLLNGLDNLHEYLKYSYPRYFRVSPINKNVVPSCTSTTTFYIAQHLF